jgi:hypothetical protein
MNGSQTSERRQKRPRAPPGARPQPPPGGGDGEDAAGLAMARGAAGTTMGRMRRRGELPHPDALLLDGDGSKAASFLLLDGGAMALQHHRVAAVVPL